MERLRRVAKAVHHLLTTDRTVMRCVWYGSAGALALMEVQEGRHLYGALVGILSLHYENMPGGE